MNNRNVIDDMLIQSLAVHVLKYRNIQNSDIDFIMESLKGIINILLLITNDNRYQFVDKIIQRFI